MSTNTEYIAIGPFVWGRDASINDAVAKMKYMLRGSSVKRGYGYVVYEVGPGTTVDEMGSFSYPGAGPKPKLIARGCNGKKLKLGVAE